MSPSTALAIQEKLYTHSMELITHSVNVARIAYIIGKKMGLSSSELMHLYEIGLIHDIGKIKIPREILFKPTSLNKEEREIMNTHPIYSEQLLLDFFSNNEKNIETAKIARHHHENWDGTGYPDRLKGNEIPLYARIITIADVYDAITSPRVYRPNPISKPLQTMEKEVGKKFNEFLFRKYATKELEKMNK